MTTWVRHRGETALMIKSLLNGAFLCVMYSAFDVCYATLGYHVLCRYTKHADLIEPDLLGGGGGSKCFV